MIAAADVVVSVVAEAEGGDDVSVSLHVVGWWWIT